jgi:hypothetical protein
MWKWIIGLGVVVILLFVVLALISQKVRDFFKSWFGANAQAAGAINAGASNILSSVGGNLSSVGDIIKYADLVGDIESAIGNAEGEGKDKAVAIQKLVTDLRNNQSGIVQLVYSAPVESFAGGFGLIGATADGHWLLRLMNGNVSVFWLPITARKLLDTLHNYVALSVADDGTRREWDTNINGFHYYPAGYRLYDLFDSMLPASMRIGNYFAATEYSTRPHASGLDNIRVGDTTLFGPRRNELPFLARWFPKLFGVSQMQLNTDTALRLDPANAAVQPFDKHVSDFFSWVVLPQTLQQSDNTIAAAVSEVMRTHNGPPWTGDDARFPAANDWVGMRTRFTYPT